MPEYILAGRDYADAIGAFVSANEKFQKRQIYSPGFALRFPRFIRLRPDKSADEADTIERVKLLYLQQKGKVK